MDNEPGLTRKVRGRSVLFAIPRLLPIGIYPAILFAMTLPFVAISCKQVETKGITGFELVRGTAPEYLSTAPTTSDDPFDDSATSQQDVDHALDFQRRAARALLTFTVLASVYAAAGWWAGKFRAGATAGFMLSLLVSLPLAAALPGPFFGASVHHLAGYILASSLAAIGWLCWLITLLRVRGVRIRPLSFLYLLGVFLAVPVFGIAFALGIVIEIGLFVASAVFTAKDSDPFDLATFTLSGLFGALAVGMWT